jgi:hypothetical protein
VPEGRVERTGRAPVGTRPAALYRTQVKARSESGTATHAVIWRRAASSSDRGSRSSLLLDRVWRGAALLVLLALLDYVVLPQLTGVEKSLRLLSTVEPGWVMAGVLLEVLSLVSYSMLSRSMLGLVEGTILQPGGLRHAGVGRGARGCVLAAVRVLGTEPRRQSLLPVACDSRAEGGRAPRAALTGPSCARGYSPDWTSIATARLRTCTRAGGVTVNTAPEHRPATTNQVEDNLVIACYCRGPKGTNARTSRPVRISPGPPHGRHVGLWRSRLSQR